MQQQAAYPPSSLLWQVEAEVEAIRRERSHGPPSFLSSKDLLDALCLRFNVMSFAELNLGAPFAVPAIRQVLDLEASLWDFVGIYVTSRAISTVNDAEAGFLELHRVPTFDTLGLGTCFALSPAVAYHFHVQGPPPIAPLSTKDVLLHLRDFRFVHNRQTQDPAVFLAYMAGTLQHPVGTLGVAVANMGRSIELMRRMYNEERKELRDLENDFRKDITARVFEITKTKFSAENREKAIGDALSAQNVALPEGNQKANVAARVASSLLTTITRLDAELDQEIARYRSRLPKNVASTIAAMDTKLRAKVVRKKMEKSRSATVSWVLCSIMAKARVLLDTDKLDSVHKGQQREAAAKEDANDDDECKCCCVGKDACSCACTCKCHVIDDDDDADDDDDEGSESEDIKASMSLPVPPSLPVLAPTPSEPVVDAATLTKLRTKLEQVFREDDDDDVDVLARLRAIEVELQLPSLLAAATNVASPPLQLPLKKRGCPRTLLPQVESLVYQCRVALHDFASPPLAPTVALVTAAVGAELHLSSVPTAALASLQAPPTTLLFTHPLLASAPTLPTLQRSIAELVAALKALPCLVDIESALGWSLHFAHEHGPLLPFVQHHLPHVPLLKVRSGAFLKLAATSTPASIAVTGTTGDDLAVHVTSMFVAMRDACPWTLIDSAIVAVLEQVPAPVDVVLAALRRLPLDLVPHLGPHVLQSLATVVHCMPDQLWRAATHWADQLRLAHLGVTASVPQWQAHLDAFFSSGRFAASAAVSASPTPVQADEVQARAVATPRVSVGATLPSTAAVVATSEVQPVDGDACRSLVESIRRDNFGIGLPVTPETQAFLQRQHQRLERALKRLSEELYAASTHFVLELIQNADDNTYAPGVSPCATFVVTDDAITFVCNEVGFQPAHVRALCDVGASTKASATGFIGQKGIGFKSVFTVTHAPEIHSNGYHLRFDANPQHNLGPDHVSYILPYWIDAPAFPDSQQGTVMHFPLHAQAKAQLPSTCALLERIQPSILLFLQQLESLELTNNVLSTRVRFQKTWNSPHLVTLHTSASTSEQWYVAKRAIRVPTANLREQVPPGASTLLQVAFPISDEHVSSHPLQSVFAYLPLQSYGFRCILQADFEVPSSREAVLDSAWNQWLLLEFPSLFVEAFLAVVQCHPHLIRLLPLLHDVQPPFHVLAQDIGIRLQSMPVVQNAAGKWVPPSSVLDAMDLFGDDAPTPCDTILRDICDKDYLHSSFSAWLSPEMKRTLGIQALRSAHLVHIANSVHPSSLPTAYHGRLLVQLARLAQRERSTTAVAAQIQHVPLLPLAGDTKTLVTPASTVFLPTDVVSIAVPFASAIQLLAPDVVEQLQATPVARAFALAAGVKPMSATDVLLHHVLPRAKAASKSQTDQHAVMAFLLAHAAAHEVSPPVIAAIKESVSVLTTRGHLVPLSRQLYLVNPSLPDAKAFDAFSVVDPSIYGEKAAGFFSTVLRMPVLLSLDAGNDDVPGLDAIVAYAVATPSVPVATALLQYLDQAWRPTHTSSLLSAVSTLTAHAWVPVQHASTVALARPSEAYVCSPSLPRRLRSHVSATVVDVTNKALIAALQMHHGLSPSDLVRLLQSPSTTDADVHVIYEHLQTLLRDLSDADVASVRKAFASAPLVFAGDGSRRTLAQCVWKMHDVALPGLVALASVYPKTLKELFVRLGVPTHPTMANVLAALASNTVDSRPHLTFLAAHWQDALPFKATLDTLSFLQAINGTMVTFGAGAYWTKGVPSWFDALSLNTPLVDVASAVNAPFEGLVQAWPTHNLETAIVSAPAEWCARVAVVCANATVRESTKHALVLDVLELLSEHNVALPEAMAHAIFPTHAGTFVVLSDAHVLAGDDAPLPLALPHPSLLVLPYDVSLRDYLVAQGMPTVAYTTHVECDVTVPDEDGLRDYIARQVDRAALPPPATTETWAALLGRLRCSLVSSLVVECAINGAVVHREHHASFLHDHRLYVQEPLNEYVVFATLANHMYGASSELASSVANALFVRSMQPESAVPPPLWSEGTKLKRKHDWANPQALEAPSKRVRPSQGTMFQVEMPHAGPLPAYHAQRPLQLTDEMRMAIGRAGEAYVYEVLHASLGARVEWINADEETGLPYDLCINHESGGREYIEVKATSTFDKLSFEMSVQELDFAAAHGSQYTIYRVFQVKPHVGAVVNCPIVKLRNPNTLLRQKKLKLSVVMDASLAVKA
ncbi:hypothetical protein SDRG_11186 [Saprolegnia diclina VS20]|uniref:Protein NO VEIN C-terminal domain-containing protein n=1 Tax=Saprolegnia diclina (strain VS20) TaxID=1156394 RepID=T0RFD3_SAPDV|nr:hypothetical protein SDRG_11186 [Saprolegnia diclina VS20]EQC30998.1 hypothetical protein SDRG_11186 [Saprolegnia diclina VS20]|eukprot:XP_008615437.1 hypothetical protein SDRG_11186 [Saprolegnia diclina VS20]